MASQTTERKTYVLRAGEYNLDPNKIIQVIASLVEYTSDAKTDSGDSWLTFDTFDDRALTIEGHRYTEDGKRYASLASLILSKNWEKLKMTMFNQDRLVANACRLEEIAKKYQLPPKLK